MKNKQRKQTKFINYNEYINSPQWRQVRERYFASNMPQKCMGCGEAKKSGFHIHHATYKRLGMEYLRDLRLMCPSCHEKVHKKQKETGMKLLSATNQFIKSNRKQLGLHPDPYRN